MTSMGFGMWYDGGNPSCYVAPKADYESPEDFKEECITESDGFYELGPVRERYARWFPVAPEGIDIDGGCYSFCSPGRGAFAVWVSLIYRRKNTYKGREMRVLMSIREYEKEKGNKKELKK